MIIGYARVSSNHQDTELQMQALRAAGCKLIFEEKASGRKTNRPILKKVVEMLEPGDELVIWKLDRIGRNVLHALLTFQSLAERNVNIHWFGRSGKTGCGNGGKSDTGYELSGLWA